MASKPSNTMDFYDIAMLPGAGCCAINPWKSRFALNFKDLNYSTTWVATPNIAKVRQSLDVPACRKFADGNDFYTLPILIDPNTGAKLGDSFDIALYLQKTYPDSGAGDLLPSQTLDFTYNTNLPQPGAPPLSERREGEFDEYAKFNISVDAVFTAHVGLMGYFMPLEDISKAATLERIGMSSWDALEVKGEVREKMMESFRDALGDLAKLFSRNTTGPFLLGKQANYADIIVGAWLRFSYGTLPKDEWEELRTWHGGVFGQLFDGLVTIAQVK